MPIFFDNGRRVDPRDVRQPPRDSGAVPRGSVPPQNNQGPPKSVFDQFAGPVERGFSGQAQVQPAGEPGNEFTPSRRSLLDLPIFGGGGNLPRELGDNFAGPIQGQISNALLNQDPFPQELVPPFNVEPGLVQEGFEGNSLLDPNNIGFTPAEAQQAQAEQARQGSLARAGQANVNLDQFNATTREVTPEELVSNQLTELLDSGSAFIENARQRGREAAQDRGALSSSLFAGASERAAIEAGLPIASADAQAFIQAASQNMQAQNNMTLAKLDSKTRQAINNAQLATQASVTNAQLSTQTNIENARLGTQANLQNAQLGTEASLTNADLSGRRNLALISLEGQRMMADSRERIAETQLNAQFSMQQGQFAQQQFMETLQQQGRVDLTQLDGRMRAALTEAGFQHDMEMSELTQSQRIQIEEMFTQPRFNAQMEFSRSQAFSNVMMNGMSLYNQLMLGSMGQGVDEAGAQRAMNAANSVFQRIQEIAPLFLDSNNWDFPDIGG